MSMHSRCSREALVAKVFCIVGGVVLLVGAGCGSKAQSGPKNEAQAGTGGVGATSGSSGTMAGTPPKPTCGTDAVEAAGAGGESDRPLPSDSIEMLGASCSRAGALACAGKHQKLKLVCGAAGTWDANGTCGAGEFCQTADGVDKGICLAEADECQGLEPGALVCFSGAVRKCGADSLGSELVQECQYGCEGEDCAVDPPCAVGLGNCTDAPGCETNLKFSADNCGACGNSCVGAPNTTDSCVAGVCTCETGFSDCTSAPGCETATASDVQNCGVCDNNCGFGTCVGGKCAVRIFVTSSTYLGNLGGIEGADLKCQQHAEAANLNGIFKAWLSDSTTPVASRLPQHMGPYVRLDGQVVASNWSDLTTLSHQNRISINEMGAAVELSYVWTGGNSTSSKKYFCEDWTSVTPSTFGYCGETTYRSWDSSAYRDCSQELAHLYCIEIPEAE